MKWGSNIVLSHVDIQLFFEEDALSPIGWSWHWCQKPTGHKYMGLFLDSLFQRSVLSLLMPVPHYFDCSDFIVTFKLGEYDFYYSTFLLQNYFGYLGGPLRFCINFRIRFFILWESHCDFDRDYIEFVDHTGKYFCLNNIVFKCMGIRCLPIYSSLLNFLSAIFCSFNLQVLNLFGWIYS